MKDKLEYLYELQLKDDSINDIEESLEKIPQEITEIEKERDGKASIIENSKNKLQENIKSREKLEREISLYKEKISKYREQMNKATTNREYQGFITEIDFEEKNILKTEEKIIEKMLESDEIMKEISKSEGEFSTIAAEYNKKIEDLKKCIDYNKIKLQEERKLKEELRSRITANLLKKYDNLLKNKNNKAISYVESDFCGICNVKIRPQLMSELISSDNIFICENCGRILFKKIEKEESASKN